MKTLAGLTELSTADGLTAITAAELRPRSDLTYKVIDNLRVNGTNVHQSLLNGCLIRNCTFKEVSFSRCDLEQVQFQNCRFLNVNFHNVELTSSQVDRSEFKVCNFDSALISDCVWRSCSMKDCSFQQAAIHRSRFEDCQLKANNLRGASVQLDTFRRCTIENMTLGDCTLLNQIMAGCTFRNVRLNAESIGSLFGISEKDLFSFDLVYLGQPVIEVAATTGLLDALEKDYLSRRWHFMAAVFRLNFRRTSRVAGLNACLEALLWPASFGAPLKAGDVTFLEEIVSELFLQHELPAIITLWFPDRIKEFKTTVAQSAVGRDDGSKLQQLASRLSLLLLEMLPLLNSTVEHLASVQKDELITARFVFKEKPEGDTAAFVRAAAGASGFRIRDQTHILGEEPGSYVVVLQTTLMTLAAVQMALWLINGSVTQIIELKSRFLVVRQKHSPRVIRDRVLLPDQNIPKWMGIAIQSISGKLMAGTTELERGASDFGPKNLERIEVAGPSRPKKANRVRKSA